MAKVQNGVEILPLGADHNKHIIERRMPTIMLSDKAYANVNGMLYLFIVRSDNIRQCGCYRQRER